MSVQLGCACESPEEVGGAEDVGAGVLVGGVEEVISGVVLGGRLVTGTLVVVGAGQGTWAGACSSGKQRCGTPC